MNIAALYLREVRSWRHKFWWLPLVGTLLALLPLGLIPLKRRVEGRQSWEEQMDPFFLRPAVPQPEMAFVICGLMAITFLLALWLARELRGAEVRDNILPDLVITTVNAFELAVAQIAAAWTIASMLVVGALPVLVPFGARVGRNTSELLLGVALLVIFPLAGAAIGYALFWWKGLIVIASRGRSFRLWMIPVALIAVAACATVARPITIPWWRTMGAAPRTGWNNYGDPGQYSSAMLPTNLVLGVLLLAALWLIVVLLLTLWERGRRGRVALCLLLTLAVGISTPHPRAVRLRTQASNRAINVAKRLVPVTNLRWGPWHPVDDWLLRPEINAYLTPVFPLAAGPILFGVDLHQESHHGYGASVSRARWDEATPLMLVSGGLFWLICALSAFCFALRDLNFVFRRPWLIHALRHPELAAFMLEFGRMRKPRVGNYIFATRNPYFDYALARSGGSRVVLFALFGVALLGMAVFRLRSWEQFIGAQPTPDLEGEAAMLLMATLFLCWLCGVNGGLFLAHLKATRQWWALLGLPVRFRTLLWGLWLPRVVDAGVIVVAGGAALAMLAALGREDWSQGAEGEHWLYAGLAAVLPGMVALGASTSTFAASWSRGSTKATMLTVVLSIAIGVILPSALAALIQWHLERSEPKEWRLHFTPVDSDPALATIVTPIAASVTSCLALWGWGLRRLRRQGA